MFMQNTYTTEMKEQYIEEYRNSGKRWIKPHIETSSKILYNWDKA